MERTDIQMSDVFISWTGKDREIKDIIVKYLRDNGISVLESDGDCCGNFIQWSREAVKACSLFLLVFTENTLNSKCIPMEIDELKKLKDWDNRLIPVSTRPDLYTNDPWKLNESESAIFLKGRTPSENELSEILYKAIKLLINRQHSIYEEKSIREFLTLTPLLHPGKMPTREYSFDSLYQPRSIIEINDSGEEIGEFASPAELINGQDMLFISGGAGSGKTKYIHQIRDSASENDLVISVPCAKASLSSYNMMEFIYNEFQRISGIRSFYSIENFRRLLNTRHLVLILDGMDEIATYSATIKFINNVREFSYSLENVTLVFTSRNAADAILLANGEKAVRKFILKPLDTAQIESLSHSLFLQFGSSEKGDEFYLRLNDLDGEIESNPLLLSQLAIVYQSTGKIPQNIVEIYDAVFRIISRIDSLTEFDSVPPAYKEMLELDLSTILKAFSQERYKLLSQGKNKDTVKIFSAALKGNKDLKEKYGIESRPRAEFLVEYLQNRSILIDGEFYHKMFLEYFTAVAYYEQAFDDYDEIEDDSVLNELFSHYNDMYWLPVIKLFLVKADSCIDDEVTKEFYRIITSMENVCDYTLLFDTCRDLIHRNKEEAQTALLQDILRKSIDGTYPAYGPLFWYVPEYELYGTAIRAAEELSHDARALALGRDVCVLFSGKHTAAEITDKVDGYSLYQNGRHGLSGVRDGLCELFYTGKTSCSSGADIYPRFFNVEEERSFAEKGHGIFGRMSTPFHDELGLWKEESLNEFNGEYVGVISSPYFKEKIESRLSEKPTSRITGIVLYSTDDTVIDYIDFIRTSVRTIYIPENTTSINEGFDRFTVLDTYIKITDNSIVYIPKYATELAIPEGITVLEEGFIKNNSFLTTLSLPRGLREIKNDAFFDCVNLRDVSLPDTLTSIGDYAFHRCGLNSHITIPDSVTKIGENAFSGCLSLPTITVSSSVLEIGESAFEACRSLKYVNALGSVSVIKKKTFCDCENLLEVAIPRSVTEIQFCAFSGCKSLKKITIPSSVNVIGGSAFCECTSLEGIELPDNITVIDGLTFCNCESLRGVTIPDAVTEIGCYAFSGTQISSINIPESVKVIGIGAFLRCDDLREVTLSDSVTEIKSLAFSHCPKLCEITIPDSVKILGTSLFYDSPNLKKITMSAALEAQIYRLATSAEIICKETGLPFSKSDISNVIVVEDGRTEIEDEEFIDSDAEAILIPYTLERIGAGAFANCFNLSDITIPDAVTAIEEATFSNCKKLRSVHLPRSLEKIGIYAFQYCSDLESISLPDSVTLIGHGAFSQCKSLKDIIIPSSVQAIEGMAFQECESLEHIDIPDSIISISEGVFEGCTSLERITLPKSLEEIGSEAFSYCKSLKEITIPNSIKKLEDGVFQECTGLTHIVIPDSVTEIGQATFLSCTNLESVTIPGSVTKIGWDAFEDCISLKGIAIPDSVLEIMNNAFSGCTSLTELRIPKSVRKIGFDAFAGCTGLVSVHISANFKNSIENIFGEIDSKIIHWID
jgi:hypothetical protein